MFLGSGRLVLHVSNERKSIVLENVLFINTIENALKTQMSRMEVRLTTDQKAFSVVFIIISASRSGPASEAEMKSWIKKPETIATPEEKPAAVEAAVVEARDPSLVGHWKLDEAGATALDASGRDNSGILVGEPSRVPGKFETGGHVLPCVTRAVT